MRARAVFAAIFPLLARASVACSHESEPGEYCGQAWLGDYDCPNGYQCSDNNTCQPTVSYATLYPDASSADAGRD